MSDTSCAGSSPSPVFLSPARRPGPTPRSSTWRRTGARRAAAASAAPGTFRRPWTSPRPCSRATRSGCAAARTSATSPATSTAPPSSPIIVRQYAGRAGHPRRQRRHLQRHPDHQRLLHLVLGLRDHELQPQPHLRGHQPASQPRRGDQPATAMGTKLINMIIHDTTQGILSSSGANGTEIYGNLIYYNGYSGTDRGHGHGIYVPTTREPPPSRSTTTSSSSSSATGSTATRKAATSTTSTSRATRPSTTAASLRQLVHQHPRRRPAGRRRIPP